MTTLQQSLTATPIALTVELDLAAVSAGMRPPPPLTKQHAGILADAIAADLARIVGERIQACGLVISAALYDLTELLRPGLPWVEILLEIYRGSCAGRGFVPQVLALGGDADFPIQALAPLRRPGSGPLLVLPLLLVADRTVIEGMQRQLEETLLEQGRCGLPTEEVIRRDFGLAPRNLNYATFNDLSALLKLQLDRAGLDPLWQLLEGALFRPHHAELVQLPEGNRFVGRGGEVYTLFYTFDQWAGRGLGDSESYRRWLLKQRLYEAGLAAHGLRIRRLHPAAELASGCSSRLTQALAEHELQGELLREPDTPPPPLEDARVILLTEHSTPELGPVAYTVLAQAGDGRVLHLANEYPLTQEAARDVRERWAETAARLGLALHLAQPGRLLVSDDGKHLLPQVEFGEEVH
ncbi:MAG: hypothetical protein GX093_07820 [Xanthomonadaceae bacterium]|nr:hypothetical protein [Xanthomonadaceae bacterium]